ncbi:TetR/AcrR family transcriptional regulator [Microbacterium hominis]|uniref:TetR/AcrR family transcriptional regulator n=1 Tax=Microbacterium hominis TaxID=162426 RepID=A0A7D4UHA4_9MICO|nr:TetR/AcrR family transcriptional regulator [Microbacterium hominis]QKJ18308.1 TetR/AcrR family transcriptional regulator [Microbacterium hominis]
MTTPAKSAPARGGRGGEKTRLDRRAILEAGLALAGQPGVTAISVRDLGSALGADPTAIYRHFRGKDDLMRSLLDELIGMTLQRVDADPDDWRGRLRQLTQATLDVFASYPAIGMEATVLTTGGPNELGAIELMLDAFRRAGLEGDALVEHYALIAVHSLSSAAGIARSRSERGYDPAVPMSWIESPLLVDPEEYPLIAELGPRLRALDDRDLLLLGVETILDSAERAARRAEG